MGYPQGHKEQTRKTIVQAARKLWKTKGYSGASVDKVMDEAGLTRGGFYAHFKSKDDLLVEALSEAMAADVIAKMEGEGVTDYNEQRRRILDFYLSGDHRDHPETGCPLTSLTQEATRIGAGPRQVVANLVRRFANWLSKDNQDRGLALMALIVGAVTLARASDDAQLSEDILAAARKAADDLLDAH